MSRRAEYSALVKQAEKAVGSVKDPELKRAAFEKILDDLLRPAEQTPRRRAPAGASARSKAPEKGRPARGGPQAYVEELVDDGFFKKPKTITEVKAELENRGHHIPLTSLSGPMQKLCQRRTLRRQKSGDADTKGMFSYSNW
jgi:hypothetical protein